MVTPFRRFAAAAPLLVFVLLVFLLPFANTSLAQEAAEEAQEAVFGETLEVRRVNVEVYVTDGDGKRVTDLKASDFQVFEDGKNVEITNFLAVAGGKSIESSAVIDGPQIETTPAAPLPAAAEAIPDERRLWVVIYIDNVHLRPFHRNKVLGHVRTFMRSLPAGTHAMLVSFDRSLHVRETFTPDLSLISDKTYELEDLSAFVVQKQTDRDNVLKEIRRNTKDFQAAELEADFYAKSAYNDVEQSVRALDETIELLAGLPGRKSLVYVSDGLEMRAGEDMFQQVQQQFSTERGRSGINMLANRYNARRLFSQLIDRSNGSGVTLYTIDAAGLKTSGGSADRGGGTSTHEVDITYQLNRQESLIYISDETGGLSAIGTNNFGGAFKNIADDFSHYYSLAYRPLHGGDGRRHEIDIKVLRKGLKLRYRDGYRDKNNETRIGEATLASLLYGVGGNPMGVEARTLDPVRTDTGDVLLPVEVRIPIGNLTLVPRGELYVARARVALALLDAEGGRSPVDQKVVPIEIPAADIEVARGKYFVYEAQLRIGKGQQRMVVAVRDEFAGNESFVRKVLVFAQ